nr:tyrosine-type recombinase/integrase [Brucella anthropi]
MKNPFHSALKSELQAFLLYKRAMGFRYGRPEGTLLHFDRFVLRTHGVSNRRPDLRSLIQGWLARGPGRKPISAATDLGVIRQFCLYRRRRDPDGFVPGREWFPPCIESQFVPYIFSDTEVRSIMRQIACGRGSRVQCLGRRLLWLLLYCTGLRFGEVARLQVADLDLRRRLLWIRESKGRTRLVPFGSDMADEFQRYLRCRGTKTLPPESPLLLSFVGKRYCAKSISHTLRQWLRGAGLKSEKGRHGPRPYDVRHTFAVHRLRRWYRQGVELSGRLPWLSTYMGHANILGTETYLTTTPELLALVSRRFETRFRKKKRT